MLTGTATVPIFARASFFSTVALGHTTSPRILHLHRFYSSPPASPSSKKPATPKTSTTSTSTTSTTNKNNHPSPIGFVLIAVAAFGAFAWISRKRHDDPEKHLREKRIPHPNPLIPPRSQEPQ